LRKVPEVGYCLGVWVFGSYLFEERTTGAWPDARAWSTGREVGGGRATVYGAGAKRTDLDIGWTVPPVTPNWYSDPTGRYARRYHDGTAWTEHVIDGAGRHMTSPLEDAGPSPAGSGQEQDWARPPPPGQRPTPVPQPVASGQGWAAHDHQLHGYQPTGRQIHRMDMDQTDQLVVRPRSTEYLGWLSRGFLVLVMAPVSLVYVVLTGASVTRSGLIAILCIAVAAASPLCVTHFYMLRAYVVITPTHIGKAGFTGRPKMRPRSEVGTVLMAKMRYHADPRKFQSLFLFDHAGRRIMRLRSMYWTPSDMERIPSALGITPVVRGMVTSPELAKEYPHAVMGFERRPLFYAAVTVLMVIIVVPALIAIVMTTLGYRSGG
jgi:hypothetical protein